MKIRFFTKTNTEIKQNYFPKAQVTPSYDVVRWVEILDIHDCPQLDYDITILFLWSHWIRCVCDTSGTIIRKSSDILRPSYDSRARLYDFTTIVCGEANIIVRSRGKVDTMCLRHIWDSRREIVRHLTTVVRQSCEVVRLHYDCLRRS